MSKKLEISLNQRLAAIGFRIGFNEPELKLNEITLLSECDLEETLIRCAYEARTDFRLLSILISWISVHAQYVVVEKFAKKRKYFEKILGENLILDLLAAGAVLSSQSKWTKLIRTSKRRPEIPVDPELLKSSLEYQGEDPEFSKFGLRIPKKLIRLRSEDVLSPQELAEHNPQYRNRLLYGSSWRADVITAIESGVKNPNQISQLIGCSYEPAYRVFRDYRFAHGIAA